MFPCQNENNLLGKLLLIFNPIIPVSNTHYVTGCGINTFSSMMSVEKNLTCLTSKLGNICTFRPNCKCSKKCKY